ncbi:MAG: hypothetical protein JSR58_05155 [Verrucomicrobia bacterium]|nr:hypothetical protein [Verrucomicrobiota bacterium]
MSNPASNNKSSFFNFLPYIGFGLSGLQGIFSFSADKILTNSKIPSLSKELSPFILVLTSFSAIYLHNRRIRNTDDKGGKVELVAQKALYDEDEIKRLKQVEVEFKQLQSASDADKREIERLKKIEIELAETKKLIFPLVQKSYALMQLVSSQIITDEDIQQNLDAYLKDLPENLEEFKKFLENLKSDLKQYMPDEDIPRNFALQFVQELKTYSADKVSFLLSKDTTLVVKLIRSAYEVFSLLSNDAAPSEDDIGGNLLGYLEAMPSSLVAFKEFVQELQKNLQNTDQSNDDFRKGVQASAEKFKTNSRQSTPIRPIQQPNFSSSTPTTPLRATDSKQQQ